MRPFIQPAAVAISLALLAACTAPTGTKTATGARPSAKPTTASSLKPSSQPSAVATAKPASIVPASAAPVVPSGVACNDAPGPVSIESGDVPRVVTLDGYEAIAGLGQSGAGLTSPVATVRLRAHPGSAGSRLMAANVTLAVGTTTFGPYRVMINPVTVPGTTDTNWGTPVSVAVPLPVGDLPASGAGAVEARVEFIDDTEFVVKDENFLPLTVTLPLSRTATATPARQAVQTACQAEPAKAIAPTPVAIEGGDTPRVAGLFSFTPTVVRLSGASASVAAKLHAPAGGGSVSIKSLNVSYHWKQPGQPAQSSAPVSQPLSSPVVVPAATQTATGTPVEVPFVLDLAAFEAMAAGDRPGYVSAQVEFVDDKGYVVQDPDFQNLQLEIPVLID